jgi:Tfp pilus assembly protein PilE
MTIIELLVTVLILGIILNIAIPSYLSTVKSARSSVGNVNSRMVATEVQVLYVKSGGSSYAGYTAASLAANTTVLSDLGGSLPTNPCTSGASLTTDYTVTAAASKWTIIAGNGSSCDSGDMVKYQLGS